MKQIVSLDGVPLLHREVFVNGVRLHMVEAGDPDGPLVILLHGFPDFWYGWKHQIPALARAGFRVIAPDQRGYNTSARPADLRAYSLECTAGDVSAIIKDAGREQAFIAGHDWGAWVAWWMALIFPQRVQKLAILNVPHPTVMYNNVRSSPLQMLRSWYIFFFQLPFLPELLLAGGNAQGAMNMMLRTSNPGSFTDADVSHYVQAWQQPGAMTSMLNWYRSIVRHPPAKPADPMVRMPVLILWGRNDIALVPEAAQQSLRYCADGRAIVYDDATHWIQHDKPAEVNARLIEFFS